MLAPTSPATWLFAPDCSATAVRDPLVDTANPWRNPDARFAAPTPIISWFGSSSSPRRAANADAVAIVSVSDTSTMPTAASINGPTSLNDVHGSDGRGSPAGSEPTVTTPCASRFQTAETIVAPTTATSTAGIFFVTRGSTRRTTRQVTPTTSAAVTRWSRCAKNSRTSAPNVSASVEKPNSFGS